jgi:hypothetical protein
VFGSVAHVSRNDRHTTGGEIQSDWRADIMDEAKLNQFIGRMLSFYKALQTEGPMSQAN